MHCDLLRAGFVPGIEKCTWQPSKQITWNGLLFDFDRHGLFVKQARIDKTLTALMELNSNWPNVSYRQVARVVGQIISMHPVLEGLPQIKTRMLQNVVNIRAAKQFSWDAVIQVDYAPMLSLAQDEIKFWLQYLPQNRCRYFQTKQPTWLIWTDASGKAVASFAAELAHSKFNSKILTADNFLLGPDFSLHTVRNCASLQVDVLPWGNRNAATIVTRDCHDLDPHRVRRTIICHKNLSLAEQAVDSNERELMAALLAVENLAAELRRSVVILYTDNANAATILAKGSAKLRLNKYATAVCDSLLENDIALHAIWVPRDLNNVADLLSCYVDLDDFSVTTEFFRLVQQELGAVATLDCFATAENALLARFFSPSFTKNCLGVDAFNYCWAANEVCWLFPPISLICKTVHHLADCHATGLLVVPQWKNAYFYPVLKSLIGTEMLRRVCQYPGGRFLKQGSDPTSCFGPDFKGNLEVWYLDFTH